MTTSTIVGVDGSATARAAARWAARDAELHHSPIELVASACPSADVTADDPHHFDPLLTRCERALSEARRAVEESLDAPGATPIVTRVVTPPPIPALLDASTMARMIVVGNRGHMAGHRVALGSVTAALAEYRRCPLTVVRQGTSATLTSSTVVVGVDGSQAGRVAAAAAFEEAATRNVPVTVVHAWSDDDLAELSAAYGFADWRAHRARASAWLDDELVGLGADYPEVTVRCAVVRDRPARALLDHAQAAQLLVVGARGRGGFERMLLGSTSSRVLQSARCPVMIVPDEH
ncbi:universal stress protein [Gordonia jinghuaiqii]|uniref:Universal stress protein n=1 Tax=Gordonia jinghuaiqii TaxID=2758710 RepID=A0A7D7QRZ1_9ACTN|nr:universal stress protein [Gordonia jinghuaiqii]MCR5978739.1 universal stress protein [Gordonia jinghuaiqii]QMT03046.1 universal stress protein [Gordonia jinghuaiqii]